MKNISFDIVHIRDDYEVVVVPDCTRGEAVAYVEDRMASGITTGRKFAKVAVSRWESLDVDDSLYAAIEIRRRG